MSRNVPPRSPKKPKKESCPCAASGQPCAQDTNPPGMPAETTDTHCVIYRRSPACEHQETDDEKLLPNIRSPACEHQETEDEKLSPNICSHACEHNENYDDQELGPCVSQENNELIDKKDCQANKRLSDKGKPVTESEANDTGQYVRQESSSSTSTSCSSYVELSSYNGLRHLQMSKQCATCKLLMKSFSCEDSKDFWTGIDNEGPDNNNCCHKKFFEKFLEKLNDKFQYDEGLSSTCTINLLKRLLKVDPKDKTAGVNLADVIRIIGLFGPIRVEDNRCILIRQLYDIIKRSLKGKPFKTSWFVGDMTRSEAEEALLLCKDHTYLIRISGTDGGDGDFVLSVKHDDHCHHLKIQGNPKQALAESHYNAHLQFAGQKFPSLPDIVDYISSNKDIEIEQDSGDEEQKCQSVMCSRVFPKSPLNGPMSGYEKTKR